MVRIKERERKKQKKSSTLLILVLVIAVAAGSTALMLHFSNPSRQNISSTPVSTTTAPSAHKALVADSLMEDYPNPELIDYIVNVLKKAGYDVDIATSTDVNLTLYSRLTDYSVIILRIHGGKAVYKAPDGTIHKLNGLFTGVPWSDKYYELKIKWLATRAFPYNSTKAYLAVLPKFFDARLKGRFSNDSVMIVASCYALFTREIADALARKGLKVFIGWEGPVTLSHMDLVLRKLVDKVFLENKTWSEAVKEVNEELGPDPIYNDYLKILVYK
ncbi:MAG: hypothetical protein J7L12_00365 [Desulfurococcales archaeon]|nr:hypothetical protein [Desulfurococcales archaeon]